MGAVYSPPVEETKIIPEIAPMRRGRPSKPQSSHDSAKPSPSPYRAGSKDTTSSDPFAALDGGAAARSRKADELSNRFPTLDQFDILHEKGDKFDFEATANDRSNDHDLSQRLTNALADQAFARQTSPERPPRQEPASAYRQSQTSPVRQPKEVSARQSTPLYQPTPKRPAMVSTGTMTSPAQTPRLQEPTVSSRPIYRFPPSEQDRPSSQPWTQEEQKKAPSPPSSGLRPEASPRLSSDRLSNLSSSARPSMETLRRPSGLDPNDPVGRSKSAIAKARPVSVQAGYVPREPEASRSSLDLSQYEGGAPLRSVRTELDREYDRGNISSDMDYLRAKEEEESNRKKEKRSSSGAKHSKRGSLSSLSLSGGKNLFAGRFGEAFRRFESDKPATPSAEEAPQTSLMSDTEATNDESSPYEDVVLDDLDRDDISPEMRRELERRRLSQEEKRVANAAAEYRRRVAENDGGKAGAEAHRSRAIQNRVQTLLGESNKAPPPPKTASGYGKYTESPVLPANQGDVQSSPNPIPTSRTPGPVYGSREGARALPDRREGASAPAGRTVGSASTGPSSGPRPPSRPGAPPAAPPKPKNLRVGVPDGNRPGSSAGVSNDRSPSFQSNAASPGEDWEANFSRRFPSLSGMEMETEIEIPKFPKLKTREV